MSSATLLLGAGLSALAGVLYFVVGHVASKRKTQAENSLALLAFTIWWYALGTTSIVSASATAAGAFGLVDLPLLMTLTFALLAVICVALWGLLYYLIYIFFGSRSIAWPLAALYAFYYTYFVYVIIVANPIGVETGRWSNRFVYENPIEGDPVVLVLATLLLVPQMLGALAYFSLYFRTTDRMQRYRIALISGSIFLWFGSSLVASSVHISSSDVWQIANRFIALAATLTVLAAYVPPRFVRARLARPVPKAATIA